MLKPLHDHVILKQVEKETTTKGGIILSEEDQEKPTIGEVIAVGDGLLKDGKKIPLDVKVGEKVVYKEYATTKISFKGNDYLIVKESDILAIIRE